MPCFVYVIQNQTSGRIYVGQTKNLENRINRHNGLLPNKPKSFTYKNTGEWKLVYAAKFKTRKEAMNREKELKTSRGRAYIKNIIPSI